jgi:hypothetical protein
MLNGKQTSIYLDKKLLPLMYKGKATAASGVVSTIKRYVALLNPTIARMEKEFAKEIPILAKTAPLEKWQKEGLRGAVLEFVEDSTLEGFDRSDLIERLSSLSVLESYALGEAIERAAEQEEI